MSRVLPYNAKPWEVPLLLDGRKKVARLICKDGNDYVVPDMDFYDADKRTYAVHNYANKDHTDKLSIAERSCPICPGDILYVRETVWQKVGHYVDVDGETKPSWYKEFKYVAADEKPETGWNYSWAKRPSILMPKEAARIWLKVKDVRVERLQDMDEDDAFAEGVSPWDDRCYANNGWKPTFFDPDSGGACCPLDAFEDIWNSTIKKSDMDRYGWHANPWVWVIEFERCEKQKG